MKTLSHETVQNSHSETQWAIYTHTRARPSSHMSFPSHSIEIQFPLAYHNRCNNDIYPLLNERQCSAHTESIDFSIMKFATKPRSTCHNQLNWNPKRKKKTNSRRDSKCIRFLQSNCRNWMFVNILFLSVASVIFAAAVQNSDSSRLTALLSVALIRFHWIRKRCRELDNVRDSIK